MNKPQIGSTSSSAAARPDPSMMSLNRQLIGLTVFLIASAAAFHLSNLLRPDPLSQPANFLAADKGYGVTIDLTQYDQTALSSTLSTLRDNGVTWLRQPVRWSDLEAAPGEFDWRSLDNVVAAIARQNEAVGEPSRRLKLITILYTSPTWARPTHTLPTAPPTTLGDFGRFSQAFAARYGQIVDYYQIWEEPNLSTGWGNRFVDAKAYAALLREAALNIRSADSTAYVLTAALAPTLEDGPLNLNEIDYLDRLYQANAQRWFDIVAGQPYGFDLDPADPAQADTLNFRRLELMRKVMLAHGDGDTPLWATAFGWNALPDDWTGPKSPWKSGPVDLQAGRTAAALDFARQQWPWLGPMLAIRWDTLNLAANDPLRGFALTEAPPILAVIRVAAAKQQIATPGAYPPNHPSGRTSSGWRFALAHADIPRRGPRTLIIDFEGTQLDLHLTRGPYRGYLWITIDGQPANVLPQDGQGRSYVVLYDPLREQTRLTLADGLSPGRHQAVITAEGGWSQWAISGWTVYNAPDRYPLQLGLVVSGLVAAVSGLFLVWPFVRSPRRAGLQLLTGYSNVRNSFKRWGESALLVLALITGAGLYLSSGWVTLLFLLPLIVVILLRPDLGVLLIAFSLSFLPNEVHLPFLDLSLLELLLFASFTGLVAYRLNSWVATAGSSSTVSWPHSLRTNLSSIDAAVFALLLLSLLSTLFAQNFGVSMQAWRTVIVGAVAFYYLIRFMPAEASGTNTQFEWRLVDAFVLGATLHAFITLYLYFFDSQYIAAEGVRRAVGPIYPTPNNLALFLERVWPISLAVSLLPGQPPRRRIGYGFSVGLISAALYLTFSKGALLLAMPSCLVIMTGLSYLRRRRQPRRRIVALAGASLAALVLALIPLSQTARLSSTVDLSPGSTTFFRLKLWQSALMMLRDHWPLGVGLDNFLYSYRTTYILPEAWQEPNLSHPHNIVLDFGTQLGVGGIVVLLWLQATFWTTAWHLHKKRPDPLFLGLMGSMVVILSHGLVDHAFFLADLAYAFFLIVGVVQRGRDELHR